LGLAPIYHMREVASNSHQDLWVQAMKAKFEPGGEPWGRKEFDQILAGYQVSGREHESGSGPLMPGPS